MSDTIVINGTYIDSYSQVISSTVFQTALREYVQSLENNRSPLLKAIIPFKKKKLYNFKEISEFLYALSMKPVEEMKFIDYEEDRAVLYSFIEGLYDFWREKHRFIIKRERYTKNFNDREGVIKNAIQIAEEFENTVRSLHRSFQINVSLRTKKVFKQDPSGAQATFLVDKSLVPSRKRSNHDWMYSVPFIWSVVLEPPVIFHTRSNKRKGVFPVNDSKVLKDISLDPSKWYAMPLNVGKLLIYVYVNQKYLAHAAGLTNLFELASPNELRKPDGVVVFGFPFEKCDKKNRNGVIYKDDTYVGIVPDLEENDYFGYAKKMILTVHNLIMIDSGRLPVHGSLARITLKNGRKATAMFVGDSGAGKSETLDALGRLDEVLNVEILIDDMGSLNMENDRVVAYGTEIGAFVRLDDLPPGYAYATIDRSIFMNPNQTNARVIVPFDNYNDIITPADIDYLFYANNYTAVESDENRIHFFKDAEGALEVFSAGARMAKGTTAEKGLSYSYFANPFGAIQRREIHEKIARKYMEKLFETGIRVGEIRTMLGVPGYEKEGTNLAAKALAGII